jgi:hypothetical protein
MDKPRSETQVMACAQPFTNRRHDPRFNLFFPACVALTGKSVVARQNRRI